MDDASATLRGFRSQALYVLHRVLTDPRRRDLTFFPEGDEDVSIWAGGSSPIESIQVKDRSAGLTLSMLKPDSPSGFVSRLQKRRVEHPGCLTKIASYGPIGTELTGALLGVKEHRNSVIHKIRKSGFWKSATEIEAALDELSGNIEHLDKPAMIAGVTAALKETNVGGSISTAIDLLMYWISIASEEKRGITEKSLIDEINSIGQYLSQLRDRSSEWGNSIEAISEREVSQEEKQRLIAEFGKGADARFDHILAGADSIRSDRLKEIASEFREKSVVLVRGASGQGKSALCWRYLRDCCAEGARFHVRYLDSVGHAIKIANALGSHAKNLRFDAIVFLDVEPSKVGWVELVGALTSAGLKVLVSVRQEDFRRSDLGANRFDFGEVSLERISRVEARQIYETLAKSKVSAPLDFEEAWAIFNEGNGGPLLEFTHIATEGKSLQARINAQVNRLRQDAETGGSILGNAHLEMLALCALANAAGTKISYRSVCEEVGLHEITKPSRFFEDEYLLKVIGEGAESFVVGLHAARSSAIVEAFFDGDPGLRVRFEKRLLPLLKEDGIESFLLWTFVRSDSLEKGLFPVICDLESKSWTWLGGIGNALIWEGLNRYERENREALQRAHEVGGNGWFLLCDAFVGTHEVVAEEIRRELVPTGDLNAFRMTPKDNVFRRFREWLENAKPPNSRHRSDEWPAVGDLCYWTAFCDANGPIRSALSGFPSWEELQDLTCEQVGRFISGRFQFHDRDFQEWLRAHESKLREKFLAETDSLDLVIKRRKLSVLYTSNAKRSEAGEAPPASDPNGETMRRLSIVRRMFPDGTEYGGRAVEGMLMADLGLHDGSEKRFPVAKLHLPQGPSLNATFLNLVTYRLFRPQSWDEYSNVILRYREEAVTFMTSLEAVWSGMLGSPEKLQKLLKKFPKREAAALASPTFPPLFPTVAVDPWGFVAEGRERADSDIDQKQGVAEGRERSDSDIDLKWTIRHQVLNRFKEWRGVIGKYSSGLAGMVKQAEAFTILRMKAIHPALDTEVNPDAGRYFLWNLCEAWSAVRGMQREFRAHFSTRVDEKLLGRLENSEREVLQKLWAVSLSMFHEPTGTRKFAGVRELSRLRSKEERFLVLLQEKTSECISGLGSVRIDRSSKVIGEACGLAITCDFHNAEASETEVALLHQAIGEAAFSESWKLFEWQEIVEKWRDIILVPLVNGKVLSPVICRLNMATLLMRAAMSKLEVPILAPAPVDYADLEKNGFSSWQFHGLSPFRELRGTLFSLDWTLATYLGLVNHASNAEEKSAALDRGRPVFGTMLGEMNRDLTLRCGEVVDSLKTTCPDLAEEAGVELREIQVRCTSLSELLEDRAEPERVRLEITRQRQTLEEAAQVVARLFFKVADRMTK